MDLITQSPVISLVVSLSTLPGLSLRALQSPMSPFGLTVACSGWDWGGRQPGCPRPGPKDEESALSGQMGKSQRC